MAMVQNFVTYLVQSLQLKLLARNTNTALSRYTNSLKFVLFAVIIRFKFNTFSIFHKNNHAHSNAKCIGCSGQVRSVSESGTSAS